LRSPKPQAIDASASLREIVLLGDFRQKEADMKLARLQKPRGLEVLDLMTERVFALGPNDDLEALYDLMDEKHVRHVPVVDREGDLVGLVTQRDLWRSALGPQDNLPLSMQHDLMRRRKIRELMAIEVDTVEPDESLAAAAELLIENKIGCLPVVEGGRLVGILTESDFVRHFLRTLPPVPKGGLA
jgi:CBS domain-containing membrane protein